jgi:hypothetical protein
LIGECLQSSVMLSRWVVARAPVILAGLVLAPALIGINADPDLWGHTRFGLDMLETHSLPTADPYSFTQDVPWVNHEWLSELFMGAAYRWGRSAGLVVLRALLLGSFIAVCWTPLRSASVPVLAATGLLIAWGTASVTETLRPQLWTLLFVAVLARALLHSPSRTWLIGLPALFVVWVNTHGGWLVGAGMLGAWAAVNLVTMRASRGLLVGIGVLCITATFLNPYGWDMWGFLAGTVRFSRNIEEWQPLFTKPIVDWVPWVITVAVIAQRVFAKRLSLDHLAVLVMLAYASMRVSRIAPLFVTAAAILLQPSLSGVGASKSAPMTVPSRNTARAVLAVLAFMALLSGVLVSRVTQCINITGTWIPDRAAATALVRASVTGTLLTWFNWGQYALWHLGPQLRVSMDGRRETIYSESLLEEHLELYRATPRGLALLRRLNPDYVWVPAYMTALRDWLSREGYRIDVQTQQSFIAARHDQPRIQGAEVATPACFPGP